MPYLRLAFAIATGGVCFACSGEPSLKKGEAKKEEVSVAYIKSLYKGWPLRIDRDLSFQAIVTGSDHDRNFSRSLVLEDETGGIEVRLGMEDIFLQFPRGRTVCVQCNSLALGDYGGAMQLGIYPSGTSETDPLPAEMIRAHISVVQSIPEVEISAHRLTFATLAMRYVNCWVAFEGVQFIDEEYRGTWGDAGLATDRHLVDRQGDTLRVRVLSGARFAPAQLPAGSGLIEGVLGYFNGKYQLRPISTYELSMNKPRFAPGE